MNKMRKKIIIRCITFAFAVIIGGLITIDTYADSCQEMAEKGLLLYQKLDNVKICKDSERGDGLTDCLFRSGNTEILLVGAIRRNMAEKAQAFFEGGFRILSIGQDVRVRMFVGGQFGFLVKVEGKEIPEDEGCYYNDAYITLDSRVLGPGGLVKFQYGTTYQTIGEKERIRYIQKNLSLLGFDPGKIDGVSGPRTLAAYEAFKRKRQIQDGASDESAFNLLAGDAILKNLIELEKVGEGKWEPKAPSR